LRYVTGTLVGRQADERAEPAAFLPRVNLSGALTRSRPADDAWACCAGCCCRAEREPAYVDRV
jgi:hypothetical protein